MPVASLSDGDLIQKMKRMGGVPAELQENREMMSIAARIFRADLTLIQNYKYGPSCTGHVMHAHFLKKWMIDLHMGFFELSDLVILETESQAVCKSCFDYIPGKLLTRYICRFHEK